jgi:hypothetical protein
MRAATQLIHEPMKIIKLTAAMLVCVFIIPLLACAQPGQTNIFTLTNNSGQVFRNINVVQVDPDGIVYVIPGEVGGGKLEFFTLPESIQKRYHYDPAKAVKAEDIKQSADTQFIKQQAQAAQAELVVQQEAIVRQRLSKPAETPLKVLQTMPGGILVKVDCQNCDRETTTYFLVDCEKGYADGASLSLKIYADGTYSYATVQSTNRTVAKYTCDLEKAVRYAIANEDPSVATK